MRYVAVVSSDVVEGMTGGITNTLDRWIAESFHFESYTRREFTHNNLSHVLRESRYTIVTSQDVYEFIIVTRTRDFIEYKIYLVFNGYPRAQFFQILTNFLAVEGVNFVPILPTMRQYTKEEQEFTDQFFN